MSRTTPIAIVKAGFDGGLAVMLAVVVVMVGEEMGNRRKEVVSPDAICKLKIILYQTNGKMPLL